LSCRKGRNECHVDVYEKAGAVRLSGVTRDICSGTSSDGAEASFYVEMCDCRAAFLPLFQLTFVSTYQIAGPLHAPSQYPRNRSRPGLALGCSGTIYASFPCNRAFISIEEDVAPAASMEGSLEGSKDRLGGGFTLD
jgi:hypothetical protein